MGAKLDLRSGGGWRANSVSRPEASGELPNLDVLRALAVGLVLLDHVLETIAVKWGYSVHPHDWALGRAGVLLFFVHTTYVLMLSLARSELHGWECARDFYVRRLFRIYPLSAFFIVLVVSLRIPVDPWAMYQWQGWSALVSNLALTTNLTNHSHVLSPLWTLPYEVQMYVLLPGIFTLVSGKRWLRVVVLVAGAIVVELLFLAVKLDTVFAYLQPYFAPCFMGGAVAYVLAGKVKVHYLAAWLWLPFLALAVICYLIADEVTPGVHTPVVQWMLTLCVGLAVPLFGQLEKGALTRIASAVAKYSYGIYMAHCVALWIGLYLFEDAPVIAQWSIAASSLFVLSILSYNYIEEPGIRLGRKVAAKLSKPRATRRRIQDTAQSRTAA